MDRRQVWAEWWVGGGGRTPLEVEADGQRLVHHAHQQRGGSLQTERDHIPLELAELRPKARLPPVRGPHLELMIATREIELGEEA